jgi:hypothetical protein
MDLQAREPSEPIYVTLAAVVALLEQTQSAGPVAKHLRRFRQLLPPGTASPTLDAAIAELAGRYTSAWSWCDADLRAQLGAFGPPLHFTRLHDVLAETRVRRAG